VKGFIDDFFDEAFGFMNLDFSLTGFCNCAKNPDDAKGAST
jgi:hypothetical protein